MKKKNEALSNSLSYEIEPDRLLGIKYKFIRRLLDILKNNKLSHIISWTDDGASIIIKDMKGFVDQVLPVYYKHSNLSNFIRQLNMYSFKKIKASKNKDCNTLLYVNEFFRKDRMDLIQKIDRQKAMTSKDIQQEMGLYDKEKSQILSIESSDLPKGNESNSKERMAFLNKKALILKSNLEKATNMYKELLKSGNEVKFVKESTISYVSKLEKSLVFLYNLLTKGKISGGGTDFYEQICEINETINNPTTLTTSKLIQSQQGRKGLQFISMKRLKPSEKVEGYDFSTKSNEVSRFVENVIKKLDLSEASSHLNMKVDPFNENYPELQSHDNVLKTETIEQVFGKLPQESFSNLKEDAFSKAYGPYFD